MQDEKLNVKRILAFVGAQPMQLQKENLKNSGLYGIRTLDLSCDTSQCSNQCKRAIVRKVINQLGLTQFLKKLRGNVGVNRSDKPELETSAVNLLTLQAPVSKLFSYIFIRYISWENVLKDSNFPSVITELNHLYSAFSCSSIEIVKSNSISVILVTQRWTIDLI